MEYGTDSKHSDLTDVAGDGEYKPEEDDQPVPLTQTELSNLTRDLNLSKESPQILCSRLKEKQQLAPGTTFYFYRDHGRELRHFFLRSRMSSLVYCNNIAGLINWMGLEYDVMERKLFIDLSSRSLKVVLLLNRNVFSSTPIEHLVQKKETHNYMDHLLSVVNYQEHKWLVYRVLKEVGLVLGVQGGYINYPCFLCVKTAGLSINIISNKSGCGC